MNRHLIRIIFSRQYSQCNFKINARTILIDAYKASRNHLLSCGVVDPDISARYLVCDAANIGYRYSDFQNNFNKILSQKQIDVLLSHCEKRCNREPVQYIIGNWDFFDSEFDCKAPILIPRPETEDLVDNILKAYKIKNYSNLNILDIGSGTGVIGITLLMHLKNAKCFALDINNDAVSLSKQNCIKVLKDDSNRYEIIHSSFRNYLSSFNKVPIDKIPRYDIIVSNPPYISTGDMKKLEPEISLYEDHTALHGGADGMDNITEIVTHSSALLRPRGEVWLEIGEEQTRTIQDMLSNSSSQYNLDFVESIKDFRECDRFVRLRLKG